MEKIITDARLLLLVLIGMSAVLHVLFVWLFPRTDRQWKIAEYYIIGMASLALVGLAADVRGWVASQHAWLERDRAEFELEQLRSVLGHGHPGQICRTFVRTEFSPGNLDETQKEYDQACSWYGKIYVALPDSFVALPSVDISQSPPPEVREAVLRESINGVVDTIARYNRHRQSAIDYECDAEKGELEHLMLFCSPLLLCVSLALGITKVSGELRRSK